MDSRLRGVFVSILTGIATVIAAILLSGLPILNMLVLVFPIPFIVIGVKRDILHGYLSLAAAIALLSLMAGPVAGVFLLALTLLPIGGIVYALKKRLDLFESSVLSCISVLASIFLFIQVYSMGTGYSLFDTIFQSFRDFIVEGTIDFGGMLDTYQGLGYFKNFTSNQQLADFFINEMKLYVPYTILLTSVVVGFATYLISRYVIKRMGFKVIDIPPYKLWYLPRGMGLGLLLLLVAGLIGRQANIGVFDSVMLTIRLIISFIFSVIGMAVVWFFLDTPRIHIALRWTIAILVALLFSVSMGLVLLGMMDHIFNLRKIQKNRFTTKE